MLQIVAVVPDSTSVLPRDMPRNKTNYVQFGSPLSKRLIAWKYASVTGEYFNLSTPAASIRRLYSHFAGDVRLARELNTV